MLLSDIFPTTIDDTGILEVLIAGTLAILLVIGIGILFFIRWSKREKARRERDVNTAINLRR